MSELWQNVIRRDVLNLYSEAAVFEAHLCGETERCSQLAKRVFEGNKKSKKEGVTKKCTLCPDLALGAK